ncbi:MAG TPA: ABC transporter permease [Prolixibacteraceae bacterium]|nr:ABC transporter permease [Prolixibacteraceae bacterium]
MNKTFGFLRKNRAFSLINIGGLAFGIACALFIVLHVYKEKSYNSAMPDHERIFYLAQKSPDSPLGNTTISYALSPLLAGNFPEIEFFARTENFSSFSNCIVSKPQTGNEPPICFNETHFCLADSDLFQIVQYPFLEGSADRALHYPNALVLSKESAEKYFGSEPALGKTLILNKEHNFTVTGVVAIPDYVTFDFSMVAPITTLRSESYLEGWDSNGQPLFKLLPKIDLPDFNERISQFFRGLIPGDIPNPELFSLSFLPVTDRRLYYNKNPLYLLVFAGFVILIVSILNYINMSTALVRTRTSEIALKKISGAGKKAIGFQFIKETGIIGFLALIISILLVYIGLPFFQNIVGSDLKPFLLDHLGLFALSGLLFWILVTLLAGFYPAIILAGVRPLTLFNKNKGQAYALNGKNIIITTQFVISILLIILTFMTNRQYRFMENIPLGLNNERVIQIPLTHELKTKFSELKDELKQIATVKNLSMASAMPVGSPNNSGVKWTDDNGVAHDESFGFIIVSEGYTQTFEMQMARGNEFTDSRPEEQKGLIINEAAAQKLGFSNPLGKQVHFWGKQNTIVGVVKDFQNNYIFNKVKPMVLSAHPQNQGFTKFLFVSLLSVDMDQSIKRIEKAIKNISPDSPFEYSYTQAEVQGYINEIKQIDQTFRFASAASIFLALIGLIALTFQSLQARIKEIGIRKVNGARSSEIILMLNTHFLKYLILAYIIACPVAWYIVASLLKGIENKTNISWLAFVFAGIMVGSIALLTVSLQSWKAASRNPVEALKYE